MEKYFSMGIYSPVVERGKVAIGARQEEIKQPEEKRLHSFSYYRLINHIENPINEELIE